METEEIENYAVSLKHNGRNCCQAVAEALTVGNNNLLISQEALKLITSGFRTGMGCMEATCGALCGAVIVAGLNSNGTDTGQKAKLIHHRFTQLCGASICKILKSRTSEGKILCDCDTCVKNGVKAYKEIVGN